MKRTDALRRHPHIYLTRNAVLDYMHVYRGQFEAARRALTEQLLMRATPDPQSANGYLIPALSGSAQLRALTVEEGPLLIVTKITVLPAMDPREA